MAYMPMLLAGALVAMAYVGAGGSSTPVLDDNNGCNTSTAVPCTFHCHWDPDFPDSIGIIVDNSGGTGVSGEVVCGELRSGCSNPLLAECQAGSCCVAADDNQGKCHLLVGTTARCANAIP